MIEEENLSGHLVLLMAPSGSGKSILLQHLKQSLPEIHFAVSCTTRAMRPGEKDGQIYYFISEEEFNSRIESGDFLEWAEYSGNRYGTLKAEITEPMRVGKVVMREVELQGVRSILNLVPRENLTIVYIDGADWDTLKKRITTRAPISPEELDLRYERYLDETAAKPLADIIVKNEEGKIEEAKNELVAIMKSIIDKESKSNES